MPNEIYATATKLSQSQGDAIAERLKELEMNLEGILSKAVAICGSLPPEPKADNPDLRAVPPSGLLPQTHERLYTLWETAQRINKTLNQAVIS